VPVDVAAEALNRCRRRIRLGISDGRSLERCGGQLGVVIPRLGLWSLTYVVQGVRHLRAGNPVTLYSPGDFYVRFPQGANIGASVYVDPATGIAYAADGGGYQLTPWKAVTNARPGALGVISPYQFVG
jgi:hypothetical protein